MKKLLRKGISYALSMAMIIALVPGMPLKTVHATANVNIRTNRFATGEQLRDNTFGLDYGSLLGKIKFGYDTANQKDRSWFIAGQDGENTTVLSERAIIDDMKYNDIGGKGHGKFNDSNILARLKNTNDEIYKNNFKSTEMDLMKAVQLKYYTANANSRDGENIEGDDGLVTTPVGPTSVNGATKLYIPDAEDNNPFNDGKRNTQTSSEGRTVRNTAAIYAGENNNITIRLGLLNGKLLQNENDSKSYFWLRSEWYFRDGYGYYVNWDHYQGTTPDYVTESRTDQNYSVNALANLDLSGVNFASVIQPVKAENFGKFKKGELNNDEEEEMTLRWKENTYITPNYHTPAIGNVVPVEKGGEEADKSDIKGVNIKNLNNNLNSPVYLVVATAKGSWAKEVTEDEYVSFEEITINGGQLKDGSSARVWLETSDTKNNMVTATDTMDLTAEVPTLYEINRNIPVGGTLNIDKDRAQQGATVSIEAIPDKDYQIDKVIVTKEDGTAVNWSPLTGQTGKYTFKMPAGEVEVNTIFKASGYKLIMDSSTSNNIIATKMQEIKAGDTVTLLVKQRQGYSIKTLTATKTDASTIHPVPINGTNAYIFIMPGCDVTIKATFEKDKASAVVTTPQADVMDKIDRVGKTKIKVKYNKKTVQITWTQAKRATSYRLYRSVAGANRYYMYKEFPSANIRKVTEKRTKTKYSYKVVGIKTKYFFGERFWQFGTTSFANAPKGDFIEVNKYDLQNQLNTKKPTAIKVKAKTTYKKIKITWTKSTNATGYRIYRSFTKAKSGFKMYAEVLGGSVTSKTLKQSKKCYYKVVPVKGLKVKDIKFWQFGKLSSWVR